jgi:SAM-dependent methyltransferase
MVDSRVQFGRHAAAYATSPVHVRDAEAVVAALNPAPDWLAADIGTGAGHTAHALARRCRRVLACDITPEMLGQATGLAAGLGLGNVEPVFVLAEAMPFAEASLDGLTCRYSAHHFRDVAAFCREVHRVLKPGGRAVIFDTVAPEDDAIAAFVDDVELHRDPSHVRDHKVSTWRRLLESAGLEVISATVGPDQASAIELIEWTRRSGTPAHEVEYIRRRLAEATPATIEALRLRTVGDSYAWEWPTALFVTEKAGR